MEQEDKKDTKNPPEGSSNPQSSEKDGSSKDTNPAEGSSKPESSNKNTPQSLKAKSKILKKSKADKVQTISSKDSRQIGTKKKNRKNKTVVGNGDEPPKEKGEKDEENKEKECQNKSTNDKSPIRKTHRAKKNKIIKVDKSEQKEKNNERHREPDRGTSNERHREPDKGTSNERHREPNKGTSNEKHREPDKGISNEKHREPDKGTSNKKHREPDKGTRSRINQNKHISTENIDSREQKREKLGGFIFMCSAKTKPDCFHYRVMGVSTSKKDIVLGIKPGTKLFLYDFDLKLLYGIYKASSSGGMKLEPRAFGGNFPVQVRFNVASDCFPLPESIFRKAIKENYNEKHKFKTELTARQVRKLTELFRPVNIRSTLQPVHSPPKAMIRDREAPDGDRGSWSHLRRERAIGDHYTPMNVERYNVLSHERNPRTERREEIPHDLFLTEKSYRAYGLQGDRRIVASASQVNPILDPYERDYERERLHQLDPLYRTNIPAHVESLCADPLHLKESEHQAYLHGGISEQADDPYRVYRYGTSPRDPYLPPFSREEVSSSSYLVGGRTMLGNDNLLRREAVQDRLYSTYSAADALSEYNQMHHHRGDSLEAAAVPVSSRYSFAGPSYSLR